MRRKQFTERQILNSMRAARAAGLHTHGNGPELISNHMVGWAEEKQIKLLHIQPGKPQQNAYVERYNRTVRYDWLGQHLYDDLEEVQQEATRWLWTYNNERPHMGIGGITPQQKLERFFNTVST